ncbi:MAG: hypothetical protein QOI80_184, partial [Solirubrobacteraceae bacterium]|nr:hypothetical protein [Solirubrobacteraceae bacterium]
TRRPCAVALAITAVALVALGMLVATSGSQEPRCNVGKVEAQGACADLSRGIPVDLPETTRAAAEQVFDADPGPDQLSAKCRFLGIAQDRVDVYRCTAVWLHTTIELRLSHPRLGSRYSYQVLNHPDPSVFPSRRGTCHPLGSYC